MNKQYLPPLWLGTAGLVALVMLVSAGCGSGLVAVEGNVTFDGQPVEQGTIVFQPADGKGTTASGEIKGGGYRLSGDEGVAPGEKVVRITAVRSTGRQVESGPPSPPGTMVDEIESYIPAVYNKASTLTCNVTADGTDRHDFELKSE